MDDLAASLKPSRSIVPVVVIVERFESILSEVEM
jgi:hypothetical protein